MVLKVAMSLKYDKSSRKLPKKQSPSGTGFECPKAGGSSRAECIAWMLALINTKRFRAV